MDHEGAGQLVSGVSRREIHATELCEQNNHQQHVKKWQTNSNGNKETV